MPFPEPKRWQELIERIRRLEQIIEKFLVSPRSRKKKRIRRKKP